jgi:hypothetical protein
MRIYLDSCVFQDLKIESNKALLELIKHSKGEFIYCFSEAHLHDLSRDKSDVKYADMASMEKITDDNCFFYKEGIRFEYHTPIEYYNMYEWSEESTSEIMNNTLNDNSILSYLKPLFRSIPFTDIIPLEELPHNMPQDVIDLFMKSTNLYDFFILFIKMTDTLSQEQKKFKELLHFLHSSFFNRVTYEQLGIKGFDGSTITNQEDFRNSYAQYFLNNGKDKSVYDLFLELYNGLEFLGFVKGKPRKQKMINMINDARHAFFGGCCDIVVSKDEDFLRKATFMYDIYELRIKVMSVSEFSQFLLDQKTIEESSLVNLFSEMKNEETQKDISNSVEIDGIQEICYHLRRVYWGYFDTLIRYSNGDIYFAKNIRKLLPNTLIKEIEYCTNKIAEELGDDIYNKGRYEKDEIVENEIWNGRTWVIDKTLIIYLNFSNQLYLEVTLAK